MYEGLADRRVEPASERLEGDGSDSALFDPATTAESVDSMSPSRLLLRQWRFVGKLMM